MQTSEEVYYRILTDPRYDENKFSVVYRDRVDGMDINTSVPLPTWIPISKGGDIPWHRVDVIKYCNVVVWDRARRVVNYHHHTVDDTMMLLPRRIVVHCIDSHDTVQTIDQLIECITTHNADIILMQSVHADCIDGLKCRLPQYTFTQSIQPIDPYHPVTITYYSVILSKYKYIGYAVIESNPLCQILQTKYLSSDGMTVTCLSVSHAHGKASSEVTFGKTSGKAKRVDDSLFDSSPLIIGGLVVIPLNAVNVISVGHGEMVALEIDENTIQKI
jgi:uncharacterized protein (UPF0248 family)